VPGAGQWHVHSPARAAEVLAHTGAKGLMIAAAAIRNPWLYGQIREHLPRETVRLPTGRELLVYIANSTRPRAARNPRSRSTSEKMKKYLELHRTGVGRNAEESAQFLHRIRRASERAGFFGICTDSSITTTRCRWSPQPGCADRAGGRPVHGFDGTDKCKIPLTLRPTPHPLLSR